MTRRLPGLYRARPFIASSLKISAGGIEGLRLGSERAAASLLGDISYTRGSGLTRIIIQI